MDKYLTYSQKQHMCHNQIKCNTLFLRDFNLLSTNRYRTIFVHIKDKMHN